LGSSTTDSFGSLPFFRDVHTSRSEKFSPFRTKLEVESRRHGLCLFAFIGRLVHPDIVEVSSNVFTAALTEVLSSFAFSTLHCNVRAVGVLDLQLAPDRTIGQLFLVARSNVPNLAPRLRLDSSSASNTASERSRHGAVKATTLSLDGGWNAFVTLFEPSSFTDDYFWKRRKRLFGQRSLAQIELHAVSLLFGIVNYTQELSFTTDDTGNFPFLSDLFSGASEEGRPVRFTELQVESSWHGISRTSIVVCLVHPDFLDAS
jgi:hypothetical protein